MSGLINLISEYSSRLAILPILAIMSAIITVIIHYINNSRKILKFLPSLIIGIFALLIGIYAITKFNTPMGLNMAWIAVFLASSALVGICVGFIIDLIVSIKRTTGNEIKQEKNKLGTYKNGQKTFKAQRKRKKVKNNE